MSTEHLVDILTEIRDQQRRQIENFEKAIEGQNQYIGLQRRGRRTFQFLVFAPWAALAAVLVYILIAAELFGA